MVKTLVPPRLGTARNPMRESLGWVVDDVACKMDIDPHAWQTHLSDVSLELVDRKDPGPGQSIQRLNAQYVGALVGRQSGKTAWSVSRIVAQCLLPDYKDVAEALGLDYIKPQNCAYTAQSRTNAVARWLEHIEFMQNSREVASRIERVSYATGREMVRFCNGSIYRPITPNRTGARGLTLDLAIVDEALAHPFWLLPVLRPTMAQRDTADRTIGAQFVVISNAGDDDSEMLNRLQELGIESLNDPNSKRVWMEWSIGEDDEAYDESVWLRTMPTLEQPNGISLEFVRMEAETLREDQFSREYLCRRSVSTANQIIPTELWQEMYRTDVIVPMHNVSLGLDVRADRLGASIVACGPVDFYLPIEVVECKQGLTWILERVVELANRWSSPVAIDAGGPAANLIPALDAAGVALEVLQTKQVTAAAASFYDACMAKRICHLNDHRLNDAITGASRRAVGDRWLFDRRGQNDISPLVAASLATWIAENGTLGMPAIH